MKKFNLFILLQAMAMLCFTAKADEVIVGTGSDTTSSAPYYSYYSYSTTSMLYKASELGKSGRITSIAFNVANAYSRSTTNVTIYFAMVTNNWLNSAQDFISQKDLVQVYSGSPTIGSQSGWEQLDLDTAYEYDGTSNLVVIVSKSANGTYNSSQKYYCTYFDDDYYGNYCLVRGGWDMSYADIYNTTQRYSDSMYRPNIKLGMEPSQYTKESFVEDGVKYETINAYKVKVIDNSYSGEITVPLSVEHGSKTYWVDEITPGVLNNCTSVSLPIYYDFGSNSTLKKLYIEEGPTTFTGFSSCAALEDVSLPGSLTSISGSFTNCKAIKTLAFRYGDTKLKGLTQEMFEQIHLDSIFVDREFDFSFSNIYTSPFSFFRKSSSEVIHTLRVIRIGDNLKTVQANMFYNCNELRTIILGNSLTTIENNGFGDCEKVEGDLVMPSSLKAIGNNAFSWGWHNAGNGNLVLNEGLETIGASAFESCIKLNVENIPSTVTSIGNSAFSQCEFEKLSIPNKVTSIGTYAFSSGAEELIIEDGYSTLSLSSNAFGYDTRKLKKLYLGRNITHNASSGGPFEYCYTSTHTLQNVEIGDKVTSIPANAFYRCSAMESITIGSKVSSIGKDAFDGTGLKEIIIKALAAPTITAPSFSSGVFSGIPVYVPAGSKASYQAANYWKNNIIIDPNDELITVNLTMPGTLEGRLRIQNVVLANVNKLKITGEMNDDDWAYIKKTNMPNMYSLDLSEVTNTSIPTQQFQSHTYLVNAVLPNGIKTIGDYAFEGSNLSGDFTMPSSLMQIGNYAFKGTKIGNVSLSSNVNIGNYAFNNSKLKSITLNKCTSIGQYAFAGCTNLSGSYQLYSQLTAIPDYAFQNCTSLEGIELPTTLKTIGNGAFQYCSKLTSVELHNAITSFGSSTSSFAGCSGIKTIKTHWMRPISILETTFSSVNKTNCTLYVPNGSTDWYLITTGWKEFINVVEYDETETLGDLVIADATEFVPVPGLYSTLSYTRNYSNTKWQSLYVPFTMRYEDWKDEYDVAYINSVRQYDNDNDGVIDETIMDVLQITGGELYPNMPYLIKAKTTGEKTITLQNAMLYQTEENSLECSTMLSTFTFTGTYSTIPAATLKENGYYAMGGGGLIMTNGTSNLKPFRWYMGITSRSPMYNTSTDNPSRISVHVIGEEDDMETSLYGVDREEELDDQIFNLNGQMMDASEPLTPGLYIKNGKKVIIR